MFILYKAWEQLKIEGYRLRGTGYVEEITVNPSLEQVKIIVMGETTTWESAPQNRRLWEEHTSHQWNTKGNECHSLQCA